MSTNETTETTPQTTAPKSGGTVIASIAIIISLAAAAIGSYNFYNAEKNHQQIAAQTQTVQTLQNSFTTPAHKKSEVSYLVHLANLQLTLGRNPAEAKQTLSLALSKSTNTTLNAALTKNIADLNALPKVDTKAIFAQLADLSKKIHAISLATPTTKQTTALKNIIEGTDTSNNKNERWYDHVWNHLKNVKQFFIIRHVDSHTMPLVDPDLIQSTKINLDMQISLAQWALLHRDQTVFQTALGVISKTLNNYFSLAPTTAVIVSEINSLEKININPTLPTLDNTLSLLDQHSQSQAEQS